MTILGDKRIVIILHSLELGGAQKQAILLASHLIHVQQAQVTILCCGKSGAAISLCNDAKIPWRIISPPLPRGRFLRVYALLKFIFILRSLHPDVILSYTDEPNIACGLVWKFTGARLCVWNQRDILLQQTNGKARWAARHVPLLVSNSQHAANFLIQSLHAQPNHVHVVHNGIELPPPCSDAKAWRTRLNVETDCILACMVANLHDGKDHPTLIKAWRLVVDQLSAKGRSAVLVLAGRFINSHLNLQKLTDQLGLAHQVRFLGEETDISGLLSAVDIGVFSSRSEGCPNGVLECMAARLPIAATNIPGIREAVGHGQYPYLSPLDEPKTLASHIVELALNPKLRATLGEANQQRIASDFSQSRMCAAMTTFISEGLSIT